MREVLAVFLVLWMLPMSLLAVVRPASTIGDNMVLQQGVSVPIYGTADPGEKVTVEFLGQVKTCAADENGEWRVELDPLKAGGPYELTLSGPEGSVAFRNVAVGEVWIASGQSNMGFNLRKAASGAEEIPKADLPMIRFFRTEGWPTDEPRKHVGGRWMVCTPETAPDCFAVGYFFAKDLHNALDVPVGLLLGSAGASCAENWTSLDTLESENLIPEVSNVFPQAAPGTTWEQIQKGVADWYQNVRFKDRDNKGEEEGWHNPDFDDAEWMTMELPGTWLGGSRTMRTPLHIDSAAVWFRRKIEIPDEWAGKELSIHLGNVDNFDTTYFNGRQVGGSRLGDPEIRRVYSIPASLVKAGPAVIAVRVFNLHGGGGFPDRAEDMKLVRDGAVLPLAGKWKFKIEYRVPWWELKVPYAGHLVPAMNYNGIVAPLSRYRVKGVIWYQGEGNAQQGLAFEKLFRAQIRDWRSAWGRKDLPFLFVQLARINKPSGNPATGSDWAALREAQRRTLEVPDTGMAVSFDVSDGDLHPSRKKEVGERLCLLALGKVYGKDITVSGPMIDAVEKHGNELHLSFSHVDGGLVAHGGGDLKDFAIAGSGGDFVSAKAEIRGDSVVVWNDAVQQPMKVRYGWQDYPVGNLYNADGLPASPFEMKCGE